MLSFQALLPLLNLSKSIALAVRAMSYGHPHIGYKDICKGQWTLTHSTKDKRQKAKDKREWKKVVNRNSFEPNCRSTLIKTHLEEDEPEEYPSRHISIIGRCFSCSSIS